MPSDRRRDLARQQRQFDRGADGCGDVVTQVSETVWSAVGLNAKPVLTSLPVARYTQKELRGVETDGCNPAT